MKRLSLAILLCAVALGSAWSQASGGRKTVLVTLTLNVNAFNASIYVDGRPIKGNVVQVDSGLHVIRVEAPGFVTWEQQIDVAKTMTFTVPLQPALVPLSIVVNAANALISVDDRMIKTNPVLVAPGTHKVSVLAPGYDPYEELVKVAGAITVTVNLRSALAELTIVYNAPDALVFVDGAQLLGPKTLNSDGTAQQSVAVAPGDRIVRIQAPYYAPFEQRVGVSRTMIFRATLQPQFFDLTVLSSVEGAAVTVDGRPYRPPLKLPAGEYVVRVTAPGYESFEQKVNLYQAQTVSAMLRAVLFDLYIQCDVPSAVFSIGETVLSGASDKVPGGRYRIRASAPGYEDVIQEVNITGNTIVPIKMRRAGSMAILAPSEAFINKNAKGNHLGLMELWVDNVQMKMNRDRFEIPAGVHRVRFISGGLWTEIEVDFQPGVTYVLEPQLVLKATPFLPGKSGPGDDKGRPVGKGDR
jgi:hypothetical protein